ncbi:hypothetical protein MesoLjLc_34170 [Mesorhizobium sp. L-8-10]|uniref:hypothetical protein n=1 Tax=unclassified Mesorhizobium TaxID=325217 RepID=UPI0019258747|nr:MULTISPECIES: hypothetical protein [unclassified Mesorhizobium]BCH23759.1 hypothetical protein MesoLjLb_35440 [Mesorhizobium sp. L-8-3]BCH31487.1 hypothetical protein MesoLjLc_34170 [Mesorhizobium sp. L-8-10]
MMKSAVVAMAIIGCDCDAKLCELIHDHQPEWTTMEECETALKSRAVRGAFDYPTVMAICSKLDRPEQAETQAAGAPAAADAAEPATVTSHDGILARASDGYRVVKDGLGRAAGGTLELARDTTGWVVARIPTVF